MAQLKSKQGFELNSTVSGESRWGEQANSNIRALEDVLHCKSNEEEMLAQSVKELCRKEEEQLPKYEPAIQSEGRVNLPFFKILLSLGVGAALFAAGSTAYVVGENPMLARTLNRQPYMLPHVVVASTEKMAHELKYKIKDSIENITRKRSY